MLGFEVEMLAVAKSGPLREQVAPLERSGLNVTLGSHTFLQFLAPPGTEVGKWGCPDPPAGPSPGGLTFTRGKPGGQVRGAKPGRSTIHLVKTGRTAFYLGIPRGRGEANARFHQVKS